MAAKSNKKGARVPESEAAGYLNQIKELIAGDTSEVDYRMNRTKQIEAEAASRFRQGRTEGSGRGDQGLETEAESDMVKILSEQQGMEFVDLGKLELDREEVKNLIRELGGELVRAYRILPLKRLSEDTIQVAISDPLDVTIADDLFMLTDYQISTVVAGEDDIVEYFEMIWGVGDHDMQTVLDTSEAGDVLDAAAMGIDGGSVDLTTNLEELANQPPVIRLVNSYLMQSIRDRASDIHIEPYRGMLRVRVRVDGALHELPDPPKSMQLGLVSRLKVLAGMNISESRVPQDGRIRLSVEGREVDVRVATLPTVHGESIVMRVLDRSMMMMGIDQLGLSGADFERFSEIIQRPNGIALVCGPTGCGKTTTLYAALAAINDPGVKIITTEDPVEYQLPGIVQVNINNKIGLTFAACLRSILRQDPDKILVGEIRDAETATIAIQAALTGHMVFSTIHANSAAACVTRLLDMGIEPFLLTSTLQMLLAQRLVRTICPSCSEPYTPADEELADFGVKREDVVGFEFLNGVGCQDCNHSGYKGRLGIFELMSLNDEIRDLILERASTDQVHAVAVQSGMETLRTDGWRKICAGITSFDEVARQTPKESKETIRMEMRDTFETTALALEHKPEEVEDRERREEVTGRPAGQITLAAPWETEAATRLKR